MTGKRVSRPNDSSAKRMRPARRKAVWPWIAGGVLVVGLAVVLAVFLSSRSPEQPTSVQSFPIQGQQHITLGQTHPAYNSDPPTSGWHYDTPLDSGFHEQPAADELVVHNLEHGHVVVYYDCSKLNDCQGTKDQLQKLAESYRNWKVTIVPRQNADAALAVAAWGRLDKLENYDEARIKDFISAWRDRGPERTED